MTKILDWREGVHKDTVQEIENALDQYLADESYANHYPSTAKTIKNLEYINIHAEKLKSLIDNLSPVGETALFERYQDNNMPFDRRGLDQLKRTLSRLMKATEESAKNIKSRHSPPYPETGQGVGSALGRGSDLESLSVGGDNLKRFRFKTPKDKLGVRMAMAMAKSSSDEDRKIVLGKKSLQEFLESVWQFEALGKKQSWDEIARQRKYIIADANKENKEIESQIKSDKLWDAAIDGYYDKLSETDSDYL